MPSSQIYVWLLGIALVAGCATQNTSLHKNLSQHAEHPLPRRILLAQPDIQVHEISAGEVVEKVDDWSDLASNEAAKSVESVAQSTGLFEAVQPSRLSDAQRATLEQYSALYILVAGSANLARHSPYEAWQKRAADFDYTLGPGMTDLAESAKLDAVVFVVGTDYISSSSRKAAMAVGVALGLLTGRYVGPESKPAFLSAGVVDMHTGELLWYSTEVRGGGDNLRDAAVVRSLVDDLFKTYPGAAKTADASKK
jgi:hypothetical protein